MSECRRISFANLVSVEGDTLFSGLRRRELLLDLGDDVLVGSIGCEEKLDCEFFDVHDVLSVVERSSLTVTEYGTKSSNGMELCCATAWSNVAYWSGP